ncbi:MAG: pseudaminic acid cytidylyltransferase [Legionellaceae bacterium]|nr:pseudaminic acid cytidylyltransferase [Legionellaceae bacterium]
MNNVAVIPVRGGSKRIPRKNIREFMGKPLVAYSIENALKSGVFSRIIVSTDDEVISDIAKSYGAEVPFLRPLNLSGDYVGTTEVIAHTVNWLREHHYEPTAVCCIYATAPFLQKSDLKKGLDILKGGGWQYVFSATKFSFPIFRGFKRHADQCLEMFFPEHFQTRSQDLPEAMHDAGQFYWGRPEAWLEGLNIFERWSTVVELPSWRVQDIDTLDDWERAEIIYSLLDRLDN